MDDLLRIGLSNAAVAGLLALAALVVSRTFRRPALSHALWLLVLVKLVTPPLRTIPIDWQGALDEDGSQLADVMPASSEFHAEELSRSQEADRQEGDLPVAAEIVDAAEAVPLTIQEQETRDQRPDDACPTNPSWGLQPDSDLIRNIPWLSLSGIVWIAGSLAWLLIACGRTWRFQRMLRHARLAPPSIQSEARRLAQRLGMPECPRVWQLPGRVSPMLWAIGGTPRLLIPAKLWPALNEEQRAALLLHELAHLLRRDHWVRALEIVTTCLYWWHPAVWWARRELREAEEQCCDAWVVWALPGAAKAYALALVETLDFLSEARPALPVAASGAGPVHDLRRRLTMIMSGATPRRLTWGGFLAVLGVAAVLLPLLPTLAWGQQPQPGERRQESRARDEVERAKAELAKAHEQLARMRDELAKFEAMLRDRQAHLEDAERQQSDRNKIERGRGGDRPGALIIIIQDAQGRAIRKIEAKPGDVIRLPGGPEGPRPGLGGLPPGELGGPPPQAGRAVGQARPGAPLLGPVGPPMSPDDPAPGFRPGGAGQGGPPGGLPFGAAPRDNRERRLEELERKLDAILRDLENLRREMRRGADVPRRAPRAGEPVRVEGDVIYRPGAPKPVEASPSRPAADPTPATPEVPREIRRSGVAPVPPTPERPPENRREIKKEGLNSPTPAPEGGDALPRR